MLNEKGWQEDTGLFERNLALVARKNPSLAAALRHCTRTNVELLPARNNLPTIRYQVPGSDRSIQLHSGYDPLTECRRLLAQHAPQADLTVLVGFGLGYVLDILLERSDRTRKVFVVESELQVLRAAAESRDFDPWMKRCDVRFAWPLGVNEIQDQWRELFDPVHDIDVGFLDCPPCRNLNAPFYDAVTKALQAQIFRIFTDINTLVARSRMFLDNFVANFPLALKSPGVSSFGNRLRGMPAVIVAAGPSLDRNIHELRNLEDRAVLISTDTALKPLIAAGIEPHFVCTGDPGHENFLHLKNTRTSNSLLVAEVTTYPDSLQEFENRAVFCTFENSALQPLTALLTDKGRLRAWGSVATMATDLALTLGCDPVVFVGLDLAHSGGRIYCSALHFEDRWFPGEISPEDWSQVSRDMNKGRKLVRSTDIFGRSIETTDKLMSYWDWMVKDILAHPGVRYVNATEGGILKEGVEVLSLCETRRRYLSFDRGIRAAVGDLHRNLSSGQMNSREGALQPLLAETGWLESRIKRGLGLCERGFPGLRAELLRTLDAHRESLFTQPHVSPLLDALNQMGNVDFLRGRRHLTSSTVGSDTETRIRALYRTYFESIGAALDMISACLSKLQGVLEHRVDRMPPPPAARAGLPTLPVSEAR